jgi:hypothetical protein
MVRFIEAQDQKEQSTLLPQYKYSINGLEYDIEFPYVTPEVVDYAMNKWFNEDQPMYLIEKEDRPKKIKCVFSTIERWAMFQHHPDLRDQNGTLILPIISLKRNAITPVPERTVAVDQLGVTNIKLYIREYINEHSGMKEYIANLNNNIDRKNIVELIEVQPPKVCTITYSVIFWSNFITDLNEMIQHMVQNFGNKHAIYFSQKLWFNAFLQSMDNISNDEEILNGERIFKTNFTIDVNAPLIDLKTLTTSRLYQGADIDINLSEGIISAAKANEIRDKIDWYSPYKLQR